MSTAWSIGKSKRDDDLGKIGPGPGTYSESRNSNKFAPSYTFGRAFRPLIQPESEAPGPGSYSFEKVTKSPPKYRIGQKYEEKEKEISPGPAAYRFNTTQILSNTTFRFSFAAKKQCPLDSLGPGPAAYNNNRDFERKKGISFSRATRKGILSHSSSGSNHQTPGPANYECAQSFFNLKASPKHMFTKSKRLSVATENTLPGPANYSKIGFVGQKGPSISISSRKTSNIEATIPGPGTYEILCKSVAPSYKIGTSDRNKKKSEIYPGPSEYSPSMKNKTAHQPISIGRSRRSYMESQENVPGPGQYETEIRFGECASKITMPHSYKNINKTFVSPGPSDYNTENTHTKIHHPEYRIGNMSRKRDLLLSGLLAPGPGSYDTKLCSRNSPHYSIGRERRSGITTLPHITPGPGTYKLLCKFADVPNYSHSGNTTFKYVQNLIN